MPVSWYYYDPTTSQIVTKKNYKDISNKNIMDRCVKSGGPSGVLALFMSEAGTKLTYDEKTKKSDMKIQYVYTEHCSSENLSIIF